MTLWILAAIDVAASVGLAAWVIVIGPASWWTLAAAALTVACLISTHAVRADLRYESERRP